VHWFSSTFLHVPKRIYSRIDVEHRIAERLTLHMLYAGEYRRNLSIERYRFHRRYARRVLAYCRAMPPPDVIVCAFPLIDVAASMGKYARAPGSPVIVDVRDLWPDTIVEVFLWWLRPLVRLGISGDFRRTAYTFREATVLTAMSGGVLRWALAHAGRAIRPMDRVFPIGFPHQSGVDDQPGATDGVASWLKALESRRLFTYVGTFGHTYNLQAVVDAARQLAEAGEQDAHFVLAGDGPLFRSVSAAAAGLPNVTVPGLLKQADVRALLARSFAGLLPWAGVADAMPNKFFEYISKALPVLSSAHGELNHLLLRERIGVPVSLDDPSELAGQVRALCLNPSRQQGMADRALTVFAARFREDLVYGDFAKFVTELGQASHVA